MFRVDADKKATISLGGVCTLNCKHCYTLTRAFKHQRSRSIEDVISFLIQNRPHYDIICVSGDTDPFIDPERGIDLLETLSDKFPEKELMFTTRLVPSEKITDRIHSMLAKSVLTGCFIFPCISVVTLELPNGIEDPRKVPSGRRRIEWANMLAATGVPVIMALRPTFPFALVGRDEIKAVASEISPRIAAVLGEVFLLDTDGQISKRLNFRPVDQIQQLGEMTFIKQDAQWMKSYLKDEVDFQREIFWGKRIPFFMRSMTAVNLVRRKWDLQIGGYKSIQFDDLSENRDLFP